MRILRTSPSETMIDRGYPQTLIENLLSDIYKVHREQVNVTDMGTLFLHIIFEKQKLNRGPAMKKQGLTPIECSESVVFVCKESVVCKVANSKQVSSGN